MMPRNLIIALMLALAALALTGCYEEEKKKAVEDYQRQVEQVRVAKLHELRGRLSSSFFIGAIGYVCIGLLGPSLAEGTRKVVADQFKLSIEDQVSLAKGVYWTTVVIVVLFSFFNTHLGAVRPAVWLLLGGTAYPFFVHVIPSLEAADKLRRKAAIGQIKSFLMLIFIFYVILRFLSPDGFGDIKLQ